MAIPDSRFPTAGSIAFIGGGNMARSLIGGLIARGTSAADIAVSEPNAELRATLATEFGVVATADNVEAVRSAQTWVLAVKPQVMKAVCSDLAGIADTERPLVVSIAAGITVAQLERWLALRPARNERLAIVRCMPNTPALLGAGVSGLYANALVSDAQRARAEALLGAVGRTVWVDDEACMHAVTAVSGSGPAYFFLLAEALEAAGIGQGLTPAAARALVVQTALGAARMLAESGEPAAVLRERVTSPGGTTQAALETFEAGGFRPLVEAAVAAATRRGAELSAAND